MIFKIQRLYDSHTHFLATGEFASGLYLGSIKEREQLKTLDVSKPLYYRGDWLVGFGWDATPWLQAPDKKFLDQVFPDKPVFLIRADGHQSWINSIGLRLLGVQSDTGILIEKDHWRAFERLPPFSQEQQKQHIFAACSTFNKAGFTHVRDMSCTENLWNLLSAMYDKDELSLAIEENVTCHDLNDFDQALKFSLKAKAAELKYLRMKGIKIFYDGSLGSETAYLSKPYHGKPEGSRGTTLWNLQDLEEVMMKTWAAGLEFSVHTIGDAAVHQIVQSARKISAQGAVGRLNLEHVELIRSETIQMMKPLHVRCHMQPCHWLSDKAWLEEKLKDLYRYVFPWEALRAAQIPLSFGCDSPVAVPSFWQNKIALEESAKAKIRKFTGDLCSAHGHPDKTFADSYTIIEDGEVLEVVFDGRRL